MTRIHFQKCMIGTLIALLVISRLVAVWPHMSTQPLEVPTDWRTLSGDEVTYDMPAYHLLANHSYSNCLSPPYEPSVLRTPTYPLVLAAIYAAFGRTEAAVLGLNVLCDIITALLLFDIARRKLPLWWALGVLGTVVVLAPWSDFITQRLTESLATLLLVLSLWYFIRPPSAKRWFVLGLCLGTLLLCRPVFVLLPAAIALWTMLCAPAWPTKQRKWLIGALFAGVVTLWSPWIVRNAVSTGRFIPLSIASEMNLWVGTWYEKPPLWHINQKEHGVLERELLPNVFASNEERDRVVPQFERYIELYFSNGGVSMREPDRNLGEIALEKIRANPWHWLSLRTRMTFKMLKQRYFGARIVKHAALWAVTQWVIGILACIGSIISVRQKQWQPVAIVFLYTWIIHFPTHGEPRYLTPAYGAVILLAALAFHESTKRVMHWRASRLPHPAAKLENNDPS